MPHIMLLGDSIFDNGNYVAGGPDVVRQLQGLLPEGCEASLGAVDGSTTRDIERQLGWLASNVSHVVVSVGGNDALDQSRLLDEKAGSVAEVLERLAGLREQFEHDYQEMLDGVAGRSLPTAICTIYDSRFPDPRQRKFANTALTVFNDVITRAAFSRGLPLIDLRLICDQDEDFANPIEPSVHGGAKIAEAIAAFFKREHFEGRNSVVFASNRRTG